MRFAAQLLNFVLFDLLAMDDFSKSYAQSRITGASSSPRPAISDRARINCRCSTNFILPLSARSEASLRNYLTMGAGRGGGVEVFTFFAEN